MKKFPKITSKDVSVVVQGNIDTNYTKRCLESIRKHLPDSEIILSTWEESNTEGLDYDKVVFNRDPGGADCSRNGRGINNCNREIVSTFQGVMLAQRTYVLKLRSDIILCSNNILKLFRRSYAFSEQYKIFKRRIIVCSIYSRRFFYNKGKVLPALFHVSDWLYFGFREDVYKLFDIPLTEEPGFSQYFRDKPQRRGRFEDSHMNRLWRFSPESYITIACCSKHLALNCKDKLDINSTNVSLSRNVIVNNFYVADQEQLHIRMPKYNIYQFLMPPVDREGLYTNYMWKKEYKKLCKRNYIVFPTLDLILCFIADFFQIKRRNR